MSREARQSISIRRDANNIICRWTATGEMRRWDQETMNASTNIMLRNMRREDRQKHLANTRVPFTIGEVGRNVPLAEDIWETTNASENIATIHSGSSITMRFPIATIRRKNIALAEKSGAETMGTGTVVSINTQILPPGGIATIIIIPTIECAERETFSAMKPGETINTDLTGRCNERTIIYIRKTEIMAIAKRNGTAAKTRVFQKKCRSWKKILQH